MTRYLAPGAILSRITPLLVLAILAGSLFITVNAQNRSRKVAGAGPAAPRRAVPAVKNNKFSRRAQSTEIKGEPIVGDYGIQRVNDEVMQSALFARGSSRPALIPEREAEVADKREQNPASPRVSQWPVARSKREVGQKLAMRDAVSGDAPQTAGTNFTGPTLTDTGAFPPDTMGAVGTSQFVAFVNGRLRSYNKTTGAADGVLNADPDVFFASVMTPVGGSIVLNFTSDPNVRYDRLTGRWFLSIIDVPCTNASCTTTAGNRWLLAVSDAASSNALSGTTVWTFFSVTTDPTNFCDYPSLGVDNNALYFGCNMFTGAGAFAGTNGYVVRKSTVLGAGPITSTKFAGLSVCGATTCTEGPYAPRGVDNYDVASNEGYFIGTSINAFGQLDAMRVSNPGTAAPTISANIPITVPSTTTQIPVGHLGNTGGNSGRLDSLDDRLFAAHIRNGRLWTAHNIGVDATGVAGGTTGATGTKRMAVRWYELNGIRSADLGGVPALVQSGTVFDNAANVSTAKQYWIPSIMVSGQGHAVLGYSAAGVTSSINAATSGRLKNDPLGTMGSNLLLSASSTAYNPASDPGGTSGRRWGDYSYTSLDPKDDMSMWTISEFCQSANSYAVRITRMMAPPPPVSNTAVPATVLSNAASVNVVVTGLAPAGEGFYDPGPDPAAPHTPFNHLTAVGAGVTVNSITYNSPTQVTLNISTVGSTAGVKTITITNPDGQTTTVPVTVNALTAAEAVISGQINGIPSRGLSRVTVTLRRADGTLIATAAVDRTGHYSFGEIATGENYIITPVSRRYSFDPSSIVYQHVDSISNINFTANGR